MVVAKEKRVEVQVPSLPSPIISNRLERRIVQARFMVRLFKRVYAKCGNLATTFRQCKELKEKHRQFFNTELLGKIAQVEGRHFWHLIAPGFPSRAARQVLDFEVNRMQVGQPQDSLRFLMFAITKKCAMHCEHCYEWDNLNQKEVLTRQDLVHIVQKFQKTGVGVIWFGGGEPMLRLHDMVHVLENSDDSSDFWVVTSGFQLNEQAANQLKAAGLTGAIISLDHYDPAQHNHFRGHEEAYYWAIHACENAKQAGLVTALSLCATREFTTEENIRQYMELAKRLGVAFVQVLEPKAVGHYTGKAVGLSLEQIALLEALYLEYNTAAAFKDYPIIDYVNIHYRRAGCGGGGERSLYIDTNGNVNLCPFCRGEVASALQFPVNDLLGLS
ncbi:MAG: radical SAM protein, partial [Saprospiraceae bacterium]|nr:radical SAM protein [Saprospiraceae bacterium]